MAGSDTLDAASVALTETQLAELAAFGTERAVAAGDVLYRAGDDAISTERDKTTSWRSATPTRLSKSTKEQLCKRFSENCPRLSRSH